MNRVKKLDRPWYPLIIAIVLFFISVVVRYKLSDFYKTIYVYRDELRYYSIAENLFTGRGLKIYNQSVDFQKILYSLAIMPAFSFTSKVIQIKAICFINAVLMSSGIFPVYLLAKSVLKKKTDIVLILILYITLPDLTYTMTFMSEVIYMPLGLWAVYLFYELFKCRDNKRVYLLSIILGILIYILYLNKEIALSFLLAYTGIVSSYLINDVIKKKLKKITIPLLISVIMMWGVFVILFVIAKVTIFSGMDNSYNQTGLDAVSSLYQVKYLLYGFFYYILCVCIAFFYFPIILPLIDIRNMQDDLKKYFLFLMLLLVASAAVIAYTITVREDLGAMAPRIHLRYICYLFIPILITFLSDYRRKDREFSISRMLLVLVGFILLFIIFFHGATDASSVDHTALKYINVLGPMKRIKIVICLGLIILMILAIKCKKYFISVLFVFMMVVNGINNVIAIEQYYEEYSINQTELNEVLELESFIKQNPDNNFLIIGKKRNRMQRIPDTYLNKPNVFTASEKDMCERQTEIGTALETVSIKPWQLEESYKDLKTVDYVIMASENKEGLTFVGNQYSVVPLKYSQKYVLYKMKEPKIIPKIQKWQERMEHEATITLNAEYGSFNSMYPSHARHIVSNQKKDFLLFGPYEYLEKGNYTITFYYDYKGSLQPNSLLGYADVKAENQDLSSFRTDVLAGNNKVTISNIDIPKPCEQFEMRIYAAQPDLEFIKLTITKNKSLNQ